MLNPIRDTGKATCSKGHKYSCSIELLAHFGTLCGYCISTSDLGKAIIEFRGGILIELEIIGKGVPKFHIKCKNSHIFHRLVSNLKNGEFCKTCDETEFGSERTKAYISLEQTISDFQRIHGDRYDYSKITIAIKVADKVEIICRSHGSFFQQVDIHKRGHGCHRCGREQTGSALRFSIEEVVAKFREAHGEIYDYSRVVYTTNCRAKITIGCPIHGWFTQEASLHLKGWGCVRCAEYNRRQKIGALDYLIDKFRQIHGDKYDYSRIVYNGATSKVTIGCKIHGWFDQLFSNHFAGRGCRECGIIQAAISLRLPYKTLIDQFKIVHGNKYDYSRVIYEGNNIKVIIICKKHGEFTQTPSNHKSGHGCPQCALKRSKGVEAIIKVLEQLKSTGDIGDFELEKTFLDLRYINPLRLDVYISELSLIFEFDGAQHFQHMSHISKKEGYPKQRLHLDQNRDLTKDIYCLTRDISLVRIPYTVSFEDIPKIILHAIEYCREGPIYSSYVHYFEKIPPEIKTRHEIFLQKIDYDG